jgi:outer membrane biosynthesis protein TonB
MSVEDLAQQAADSVRRVVVEAQAEAAKIVAAAEKEAEGIRARAEAEARDQVEGARKALEDLTARFGSGGASAPASEPTPAPEPEAPASEPAPAPKPEEPAAKEPAAKEPVAKEPAAKEPGDDTQAARLVAMKMALDGASRDDIAAELESSYSLTDRDALLDDVLAKAGK